MISRLGFALTVVIASLACESSSDQTVAPTLAGQDMLAASCPPPEVLSPADSVSVSGSSTSLKWEVFGDCRWENRIELYDDSETLIWHDDDPKWKTYQLSTSTFEYRYLELDSLDRGKYYYWRIRTHELDIDGHTVLQISPWSDFGTFGIVPETPVTSGSVASGHPKIQWPAAEGATSYLIYRKLDTVGVWHHATTITTTQYVDESTTATFYQGADISPAGDWVAYHVVARGNGMQSLWGPVHYFTYEGVQPEFN